jgi:hypothetical protein
VRSWRLAVGKYIVGVNPATTGNATGTDVAAAVAAGRATMGCASASPGDVLGSGIGVGSAMALCRPAHAAKDSAAATATAMRYADSDTTIVGLCSAHVT